MTVTNANVVYGTHISLVEFKEQADAPVKHCLITITQKVIMFQFFLVYFYVPCLAF